MLRRRIRQFSFTLTELLVVIYIIGTLAALLMPSLTSAMAMSQRTACAAQLRQLGMAFASYTADASGALKWSWDQNQDNYYCTTNCQPYPGYFQSSFFTINGTGWDPTNGATATSGFPYNSAEFGFAYYPYLNNAAVFTCPTQFRIQNRLGTFQPQSRYVSVCTNFGGLVYNHYRQNPNFGHYSIGVGNRSESPAYADWAIDYRISGWLNWIRKPDSTVLNFDVSPYRFQYSQVASPACGLSQYNGLAGDGNRSNPYNYTSTQYAPNIGFIHGTAGSSTRYLGNFSYVDGHVGTMTSDILTDATDYVFLLKK